MRLYTYPDEILSKKCAPFPVEQLTGDPAVRKAWHDLFDEAAKVCEREHGYAIAAPQVGSSLTWFVVLPHHDLGFGLSWPEVFINPRVVSTGKERDTVQEGCLSLPGLRVPVNRPREITVEYTNTNGVACKSSYKGLKARVLMHELDHLSGILSFDRTDAVSKMRSRGALQAMQQGRI